MSFWFKKYVGNENYGPIFEKFDALFMASGGPREMMMIKGGDVLDATIYVRLKNDSAAPFEGFEKTTVSDIPKDFSFLIGHQPERDALKSFLDKA